MNRLEINLKISEDGFLDTSILIDNIEFTQHVNIFALFKDVKKRGKNIHPFSSLTYAQYQNEGLSSFYPFVCSCGDAGCAGIWNGVMSKHRKHTVEWRTKEQDGYYFMRRFYSFNKDEYIQAIKQVWLQLNEMFDNGVFVYEHGHHVPIIDHFESYYEWEDVKSFMDSLCKLPTFSKKK